jgi:hypothetical protein
LRFGMLVAAHELTFDCCFGMRSTGLARQRSDQF